MNTRTRIVRLTKDGQVVELDRETIKVVQLGALSEPPKKGAPPADTAEEEPT